MAKSDTVVNSNVPFVRSAYNYDTMAASDESGLSCPEPTLTQQHAKDECDINKILERMARGVAPMGNNRKPLFGDFTNSASDYHSALNLVSDARSAFYELDAKVRSRFKNDPAQLLEFIGDERNREEAVKLGLIAPPSEDLSPPPPDANSGGKAGGGVEKSEKGRKGLFRANTPIPKGYKLVPEGGEGDE